MARREIDPRLRRTLRASARGSRGFESASAGFGSGLEGRVEVLVRCSGDAVDRLADLGFETWSVLGGANPVASGTVPLLALPALAELEGVRQIEASRPLETDLDRSLEESRVDRLHRATPALRGRGVVMGIVDSGIDFTHAAFRNADGSSRILHLWDQGAQPEDGGEVPFGREFDRRTLDEALADEAAGGDPFDRVPHRDTGGHGTHVAGIAAGSGGAGGEPEGVAPDADLIVVIPSTGGGGTLARSVRVFEAFRYLVDRAAGRPLVINQSQGMNGGGHSGETVLETGLDELARRPGVVIVKSAGNEQQQRIHAGGQIGPGEAVVLRLEVESGNRFPDFLELWHDGEDSIAVAVEPPGSDPLPFAPTGVFAEQKTLAGNLVEIESDLDADDTGDSRATLILSRGSAPVIQPGTWRLHLRGDRVVNGRFDVWIERTFRSGPFAGEQTRFQRRSNNPTRTISTPGTARRIVTVGSYVSRASSSSAALGQISMFSSRGPTRYGLRKPELVAPGESIEAARSRDATSGSGTRILKSGTSMAAPHVAGVAALVLEVRPELTCEQVKQILMATTRRNGAAGAAPDDTWGSGRLDGEAALELARRIRFPEILAVRVEGTTVVVEIAESGTAAVRFNRHQRRLQLGRAEGSRASLAPANLHSFELGDLAPGSYFVEVLAFDEEGFWSEDDLGGNLHTVVVP